MNINPPEPWVLIGRFGKPIGLDGSVRVWPEAELGEIFEKQVPLALWVPGTEPAEPLEPESVRADAKGWVAKWPGRNSRESVGALTNAWIVARRQDLPEPAPDHAYLSDLIGARVETKEEDEAVGVVTDVLESPASPVLVVGIEGGSEFLVPLSQEVDAQFIMGVEGGEPNRVRVNLPEGMREATMFPLPEEGKPGTRKPRRKSSPREEKGLD